MFADYHTKLARLARIKGVTRDIAMTAAKFEAAIIEAALKAQPKATPDQVLDNRRRKFDCFHLATAVALGCQTFYAFDDKFEGRCKLLGIPMVVEEPSPKKPKLPFMGAGAAASPTP
jgi:predicted nucleic acid-binding protein